LISRFGLGKWLLTLAAFFYFAIVWAQTTNAPLSPLVPLVPLVPSAQPTVPAFVPLAAPAAAQSATKQAQDYQRRFEQGILLMDRDINKAVEVFQTLYWDTKSVRVQLELARSLYIASKLEQAKEQFILVLAQPIPITVRDKVEWYLSEIQKRQTLKFYVGVYQDSNPGQITAERTFNIFGQTLNYQPNLPTSPQMALNLTAEVEREFQPNTGFFVSASLVTSTYLTSAFNKQVGDTSFIRRWQDFDYKDVRIGNEFMFYGNNILYDAPYVSTRFVFNQPNQNSLGVFAKASVLNFPNYAYLNGSQIQAQLNYQYSVVRNWTVSAEVGADRTAAQLQAFSSYGMFAGIGTQVAEDSTNLQLNLKAVVLRRNYWDIDPIWGDMRSDGGMIYSATLTKRDLYVFGLRPEIGFIYQSNNSTIPFYSYSKSVVGLFLKNVY
jgi:hypothetical protein